MKEKHAIFVFIVLTVPTLGKDLEFSPFSCMAEYNSIACMHFLLYPLISRWPSRLIPYFAIVNSASITMDAQIETW